MPVYLAIHNERTGRLSIPSWRLGGASVSIMPRSGHRPVDATVTATPRSHSQLVDPLNQGTFVVVSAACRTRGTGTGALGVLRNRFSVCRSSRSRCIRDTVFSNAATGDHSSFCRFRPAVSVRWSARPPGTYSPIFCIEFVSKLSRQSLSPSTDNKFASSLSVNCHDSHFHRLPTISLHRVCQ